MPSSRPNVIVFFTDQQRYDSSGLHGNPLDLMPNFDAAAIRGTHLYNSFTCQPVCGPARATLQTGMYATQHGVWKNELRINPGTQMLGQLFSDAGYSTGYIGKWHLGDTRQSGYVPPELRGGYQYWLGANHLESTSDAYRCDVYDSDGKPVRLPGYRVDGLTDAAIRFIDDNQTKPFFLFISFLEPHHQNRRNDYPAPDGYAQRYTGRWMPPDLAGMEGNAHQQMGGYWGMCKRLDEAFGRLLDALRSLGLYDNTAVLYDSDHGCHFLTRNIEYKRSCHESSIRVPTMLCGGPFEGGGRITKLVSLVDIPPTLLDTAGIPIPPQMMGRSILPLLHGKSTDWPDDVFIQVSEAQVGRAIRTRRWKYGVVAPDKDGYRDGGSNHYVEESLYDLLADPYELSNLNGFSSHRVVADRMKQRLIRRMVEAGEAAPTIQNASSAFTDRPQPTGWQIVDAHEVDQ